MYVTDPVTGERFPGLTDDTVPARTQFDRVYVRDREGGIIVRYFDSHSPLNAYQTWLALPKGTRAAIRMKNDSRPVYSHDYVDRP